jgi:hypothetical protein
MDWNVLSQNEKQKYLDRAKDAIEKGFYVGYSLEELAKVIYKAHERIS